MGSGIQSLRPVKTLLIYSRNDVINEIYGDNGLLLPIIGRDQLWFIVLQGISRDFVP